jgi:hypothetical protein
VCEVWSVDSSDPRHAADTSGEGFVGHESAVFVAFGSGRRTVVEVDECLGWGGRVGGFAAAIIEVE